MRKTLFILFMLPLLCLSAQKVDDIFTFAADGSIQTKPVYYNEVNFFWTEWLKLQDVSTATFRTQDQTLYTIKLEKSTGEADVENVFNKIEIKQNNLVIYSMINEDLWSHSESSAGSTRLYEVISLSQTASALLFFGWPYGGDAPLLTIVVVNKGKAKMVFNRHCCILNYEDKKDTFSIIYSDQYQEYIDENTPIPADNELNKFKIWKSGGVLKFQQIQ